MGQQPAAEPGLEGGFHAGKLLMREGLRSMLGRWLDVAQDPVSTASIGWMRDEQAATESQVEPSAAGSMDSRPEGKGAQSHLIDSGAPGLHFRGWAEHASACKGSRAISHVGGVRRTGLSDAHLPALLPTPERHQTAHQAATSNANPRHCSIIASDRPSHQPSQTQWTSPACPFEGHPLP